MNVHEHRHFQKWEGERKRILDEKEAKKIKKRRDTDEHAVADREKAVGEVGEEMMGDADAMWAEVAAYEKSLKKKRKPKHGKK